MQEKQEIVKRAFDIAASFLGLLFLSPLITLIALTIKIDDGGPVVFSQVRMGKGYTPFKLYKFRTMVVEAEKKGAAITVGGDERITRIGRILRRYKLDELPQLLNVIMGHMSLVGPRPEVPLYTNQWPEKDRKLILSIKPGITDYASFCYSDEQQILSSAKNPSLVYIKEIMPRKLELYKKYIIERNTWLDLRIILATLGRVAGLNLITLLPELNWSQTYNIQQRT